LPDINDLGARPTPVNRRQIAQNPRAGVVGEAVAGLGQQIGGIGQRMQEKEDKLSYAKAKSHILKEDIAARQELEADPANYATWNSRYGERMKKAREEASGMIRSRGDRTLFEADVEVDIARGSGEVAKGARVRFVDAEVAGADARAEGMQDAYVQAKDEKTRTSILEAARDTNNSLFEQGFISAQDRDKRNRSFADGVITQRTTDLFNAGDIEEARKFFEASRKHLDPETERVLNATLIGGENNRKIIVGADAIMSGGFTVTPKGVEPGIAPGIPKSLTVETLRPLFVAQESGGNYAAVNKESGAMGAYQIMPDTGRQLARKLGVPWKPELMTATSPVARQYQDALGTAMIKTVIKDGNGDPETIFALYYAGPDRKGWGPRTRKYVKDMLGRLGMEGGQRPAEHNLNDLLGAADAYAEANGFTPEMRESLKGEVSQRVQRDEVLYQREQREIGERVSASIDARIESGKGITDPSQIGPDYYRLSPAAQREVRDEIRKINSPESVKANGLVYGELTELEDDAPADFANTDLRPYQHSLTPAEYQGLKDRQRKIREQGLEGEHVVSNDAAKEVINMYGPTLDIYSKDATSENTEKRERYLRLMERIKKYTRQITGGKRPATDADVKVAFDRATMEVEQDGREMRQFEADPTKPTTVIGGRKKVPPAVRQRIISGYRAAGRPAPTESEILQEYLNGRGRLW
jgi:hypothetical protein